MTEELTQEQKQIAVNHLVYETMENDENYVCYDTIKSDVEVSEDNTYGREQDLYFNDNKASGKRKWCFGTYEYYYDDFGNRTFNGNETLVEAVGIIGQSAPPEIEEAMLENTHGWLTAIHNKINKKENEDE